MSIGLLLLIFGRYYLQALVLTRIPSTRWMLAPEKLQYI